MVATAEEIAQATYWRIHVRRPVQFTSSMQTLADAGCKLFLEIGPNRVLLGMEAAAVWNPRATQWLGSYFARAATIGRKCLPASAQLHVSGVEIDWAGFERDYFAAQTQPSDLSSSSASGSGWNAAR